MNDIPAEILAAAARRNFWSFLYFWDKDFFNDRRPFLYDIATSLQDIADSRIGSMSISLPPRAGKSYMTSLFSVWLIGRDPEGSVMRNSVTVTLYNKFSYDSRSFIRDPRYRMVFPGVKLAEDKQSVAGWNVTQAKQVSYFGSGVNGTIIGFGASLAAITDDLYKGHEEALSETINEKTHRFYESAHLSRLEKNCPRIDIGTRWLTNDVIGKNLDQGRYDKSIVVPALIDNKSFCEDVRTTKEYLELKEITDEFIWNSEYMQRPIQLEGVVFPRDQLQYYDTLPEEGIDVFYTDTADEGEDYYCTGYARIADGLIYLKDVTFNRYNLSQNEPILLAALSNANYTEGWIEANSFGAYYIRNIRKEASTRITAVKNVTNKMLRILAEAGYILQRFRFPKQPPSPEYERFLLQVCNLLKTGSKHDDGGDMLAGLSYHVRRSHYVK